VIRPAAFWANGVSLSTILQNVQPTGRLLNHIEHQLYDEPTLAEHDRVFTRRVFVGYRFATPGLPGRRFRCPIELWVAMNGTVGSTMCLDADVNNGANGARVQLWQCNRSPQQTWNAGSNYGGIYLRNAKFGKCLDADLNHIYENGGRGADVGL
jgi:hypothetical protein